jgi:hypothetical protein
MVDKFTNNNANTDTQLETPQAMELTMIAFTLACEREILPEATSG